MAKTRRGLTCTTTQNVASISEMIVVNDSTITTCAMAGFGSFSHALLVSSSAGLGLALDAVASPRGSRRRSARTATRLGRAALARTATRPPWRRVRRRGRSEGRRRRGAAARGRSDAGLAPPPAAPLRRATRAWRRRGCGPERRRGRCGRCGESGGLGRWRVERGRGHVEGRRGRGLGSRGFLERILEALDLALALALAERRREGLGGPFPRR